MCGFAGIFHFGRPEPVQRELLERMGDVLAHRGPDGAGSYASPDGRLGLVHRRLAIIDLEGGVQPMARGRSVIAYNGELYNFKELRVVLEHEGARLSTHSDTEALLELVARHGHESLARLNGIFAFAFRHGDGPLLLARDHLGVKPLYFTLLEGALVFASEIKAILLHPEVAREVDVEALAECLAFRFVPSPKTLFKGIRKLGPGQRMSCDRTGPEVRSYFDERPIFEEFARDVDAIDVYAKKLSRAVKRQMVADVPVGLMLSGGVDSALVGALMRSATPERITGYTIGFEGGEATNEIDDAAETARVIGVDHRHAIISAKDYERFFSDFVWHLEEPSGNESAPAAYFVAKLARPDVKVLLSGQGADEPLAGYDRHLGERYSKPLRWLPESGVTRALEALGQAPIGAKNEKLRRSLSSLGAHDPTRRFVEIYSIFSPEAQAALFKDRAHVDGLEARLRSIVEVRRAHASALDPVSQLAFVDTRLSLPDDLLTVADKMSMAASLELRVPYLDVELVRFLESLPTRFKLRRFRGKWIHRMAATRYLPTAIVQRPKRGFANPVDRWIRRELGASLESLLVAKGSIATRFFDASAVRALIDEDRAGRVDRKRNLFLLLVLELWNRRFILRA